MSKECEITSVDVLVVGGGTSGTIAAIQAAKAGATTILIERGSVLGGTITSGGVSFPGLFDAWGKQIIAGIGWDLVKQSVELDGGTLPDFKKTPRRHWQNQIQINPFIYMLLAEEACHKAGVMLLFYEFPISVEETMNGWIVDVMGPGSHRQIHCKQIVDCTGSATIIGLLHLPRLRENEIQPGSLLFKLGSRYEVGRKQLDSLYVLNADSSTSTTLSKANMEGRRLLLEKVQKSKNKSRLIHMQPEIAFRESYRIVGETMITINDYLSGRLYEDAICYAFYPVDLHTPSGVKPKNLVHNIVPTIPLSALIPKNSRNLIVAGRCLSSDRLANSGLRVQASCMAMGQVAGATASLAAQMNLTPIKVTLKYIKDLLRKNGAIVP
jgi:hypothetical protein